MKMEDFKNIISSYTPAPIKAVGNAAYVVCFKQPEHRAVRYAANVARIAYAAHAGMKLYSTGMIVGPQAVKALAIYLAATTLVYDGQYRLPENFFQTTLSAISKTTFTGVAEAFLPGLSWFTRA